MTDSGCGVPAGELERIFQPFVTTKPNGMGMGLAICRSVAESHRGQSLGGEHARAGRHFICRCPWEGRSHEPASTASRSYSSSTTTRRSGPPCKRGLNAEGFAVNAFESADAFLAGHDPEAAGLPRRRHRHARHERTRTAIGPGRPRLQRDPSSSSRPRGSIPMSVQAMRAGAVTFLPKPVRLARTGRGRCARPSSATAATARSRRTARKSRRASRR